MALESFTFTSPFEWRLLPLKFIRDIGRYQLNLIRIILFTNYVEINLYIFAKSSLPTNQDAMPFWILFNDLTGQDCFNHLLFSEAFFPSVLYGMKLDLVSFGPD